MVSSSDCVVSIQATYLQITCLNGEIDSRQGLKYSLGSRTSVDPIFALIKGCQWSLDTLIEGLEALDFNSNVRDNSLLNLHSDLTARKFFSKDRYLSSPRRIGTIAPLSEPPAQWQLSDVIRALRCQQFSDFKLLAQAKQYTSPATLLLALIQRPKHWSVDSQQGNVQLRYKKTLHAEFKPRLRNLAPRLSSFN